jgi:hypothetical protein
VKRTDIKAIETHSISEFGGMMQAIRKIYMQEKWE